MPRTIDRKISGKGTTEGESYIRQSIGHLEIYQIPVRKVISPNLKKGHTSLPSWTEVPCRPAWVFMGI